MSLYRPGGYPYPCKIVTSEDFAVDPLSCFKVGALEPGDTRWHGRVHTPGSRLVVLHLQIVSRVDRSC
jgi:hypothetical protein